MMIASMRCQECQERALKLRLVLRSAVLVGLMLWGTCGLYAAEEAPPAGLRGILPESAPADLTGSIAALPESWKDWGDALSDELATLYEKPDADVAQQRQATAALRKRVELARRLIADPQYR